MPASGLNSIVVNCHRGSTSPTAPGSVLLSQIRFFSSNHNTLGIEGLRLAGGLVTELSSVVTWNFLKGGRMGLRHAIATLCVICGCDSAVDQPIESTTNQSVEVPTAASQIQRPNEQQLGICLTCIRDLQDTIAIVVT